METETKKEQRKSLRLKDYDYSRSGAYFVTICTQDRLCLFGEITEAETYLNEAGNMVESALRDLCSRFINIDVDEYTIMPNHLHLIVRIKTELPVGVPLAGCPITPARFVQK